MNVAVKYTGPMADPSGYGEANRNYICALDQAGVDLTTEIFSYSANETNVFGDSFRLAKKLEGRDIDYDIKIIHVPCDAYLRYMEPCKYHIGHLFWETDRMSPEWVWNCNLVDEIWTGSEHNKQAFEKSGVTRPIWVFPQAIDTALAKQQLDLWEVPSHRGFLFYSIFQWIQRKNPELLVKAYLSEFGSEENVSLLIKTYREKFTEEEKNSIESEIRVWKQEIGKQNSPPIYLNVELMSKKDVFRLHKTGDCFVLPHYGEGWSICEVEAMLFGKPVIATNLGGVHDWLTKESYLPLPYKEVNVSGMEFAPWYRTEQLWGKVDINDLRKRMRWVYENQEEAGKIGKLGQEFVHKHFSFLGVGEMLKSRLGDIQKMLDSDKEGRLK